MDIKIEVKSYLLAILIFSISILFAPSIVEAATSIYFNASDESIYTDDEFLVTLRVGTPDRAINVIDGTILFDNSLLEIKEVSTGGSLLTVWQKEPTVDNSKGKLSFVGGIPGGFQGEDGEVLKISFFAKNQGDAVVGFLDGFSVYLHDGRGTQLNPWLTTLSVTVLEKEVGTQPRNDWQELVEQDETPPEPFEVEIGQDISVYDNQHFISFYSTDSESGIDHYEVQEGGGEFVEVTSPYLLEDQSLKSSIIVKVVDEAGNERLVEYTPEVESIYMKYGVWVVVIILMILIYIFLIKQKKQK